MNILIAMLLTGVTTAGSYALSFLIFPPKGGGR